MQGALADAAEEAAQVGVAHEVALLVAHGLDELHDPDGRICETRQQRLAFSFRLAPCLWHMCTRPFDMHNPQAEC